MSGMGDVQGSDDVDDVLIAGGGQVGLALALALKRSAPDLAVTLVDAEPGGTRRAGRASTITAGSCSSGSACGRRSPTRHSRSTR